MKLSAKEWQKKREAIKHRHISAIKLVKEGIAQYKDFIPEQLLEDCFVFIKQTEPMTIEELRKEFEKLRQIQLAKNSHGNYRSKYTEMFFRGFLMCVRHFGMIKE